MNTVNSLQLIQNAAAIVAFNEPKSVSLLSS